jgi:flagellar hook-associated protein 3 FlgL
MIGTTYSTRLASLTQAATRVSEELSVTQERAVTGLAVTRPSDAPEQVASIHALSSQLADQSIWASNAAAIMSDMDVADSALDGMADIISEARALATQLSSGTYSEAELDVGAEEVLGMLEDLIGLANTDVGGRHLFAGNASDSAAFDASGTYLGDTDAPTARTGSNQEIATGFDGSALFQGDVDIFGALTDLAAALSSHDQDAVADTLEALEASTDQISFARAQVGEAFNSAEDAATVAANMETLLASAVDQKTAADPVATYTRLAELQSTYEAVLQIAASSQSTNLFSMM